MGFAVEEGGPTACKNKLIAFSFFFLLAIHSHVASTRLQSDRETRWYDYGHIINTTQSIWSIRELISRLFSGVAKFTVANSTKRAILRDKQDYDGTWWRAYLHMVFLSPLVCTVCTIRTNDAARGHVNTRAWVMGLYLANGLLCDPFTTVQL